MAGVLTDEQQIARIMQIPGLMRESDVQLLYDTVKLAPANGLIVELGTYLGRSAAALWFGAERGRLVYSIDDYSYPNAENPPTIELAQAELDKCGCKAHLIQGDSRKPPEGLRHVAYLHVDTQHTRAQFVAEMTAWLPRLVEGALVACHDYGSPKWLEMTPVIREYFGKWEKVGSAKRMIVFRKPQGG